MSEPGVRTVEQLNRVSDFGFHSPQLVSKQGSQVIVCFFPIDRFLTPGFRKLFLKSPALFFAPLQMLFDKTSEADVKDALEELGSPFDYAALRDALKCFMVVQHDPGSAGYAPCLDEFGLEVADRASAGRRKGCCCRTAMSSRVRLTYRSSIGT